MFKLNIGPVQKVVCHLCSEAESKGGDIGVVDGCVASLTFMQEIRGRFPKDRL